MTTLNTAQNKLHIKSVNWQTLTWMDIEQPAPGDIDYLKKNYHFYDLELDDCLRHMHRPLIDTHEEYIFMMFHFPVFHRRTQVILPGQVSVFLGRDYLITLHEGDLEPLVQMFKNCELNENARREFMARSSAHLLYHILDHLVNYCFTILNGIGDAIEKVQEQVFRREIRETVPRNVSVLRRNIISFHRIMRSQTEVFELLEQSNWPMLKEEPEVHFSDLVGHSSKIRDELDDYKEVIEVFNDTSNTLTSFRTNQVIRALTLISTIMLPLTLVASIFGMHLEHLPLSQSPTSFLIIMVIMAVIIVSMLALFRLRRWL